MEFPVRKTIRLKDYDYSQNGAYFVTICTHNKQHSLGYIRRDDPCGCPSMHLTQLGEIAKSNIEIIEKRYDIKCEKFVIMPNHVHLILEIQNPEKGGRPLGVPTLSRIINQMKGYVSKNIGHSIWHTRYHEHVIRSEKAYQEIWQYIDTNPQKWELDCYYTNQNV